MARGNEQDSRGLTPADAVSGHADDWEDLAIDYVDDRLDPETKAAIDRHLAGCVSCAARLGTQRNVLSFVQECALQEAPTSIEDEVLGEVLFPAKASQGTHSPSTEERSRWSLIWTRRIRPWVPATVAVVALLAAVLTYGVLRSESSQTAQAPEMTTVADARSKATGAGDAAAEQAMSATAETNTTAGATTLVGAGALPPTTTAVAATTTTMVAYNDATTTQDRKSMIADLEGAGSPVYFAFDAARLTAAGRDSAQAVAAVAQQITELTGLEPLDEALTLDGPTFAAYVPRDDAAPIVDLLRSIGANLQLTVSLSLQPVVEGPDDVGVLFADLLQRHKAEFPELSAFRTPQPAVSNWSFTTSTLVPPTETPPGQSELATPDEAGTHVLIVIYVRR